MSNEINRMRTTTLLIQKPEDYNLLSQHHRLERYIVPYQFRSSGKFRYDSLHVRMKEQLNYPYVPYQYDKIDGSTRMVIYVLYPRDSGEVKNLILDFLSNDPLEHREVGFEELAFHMLIKLLQTAYFRGKENSEFVAQGKCYVFARNSGNADICLQIELRGDRSNKETDTIQAFQVVSHATRFIPCKEDDKLNEWQKRTFARYRRIPRDGQVAYNQLRPEELDNLQGQLYRIHVDSNTKPTLDFHHQYRLEYGRGKILYDFTHNFIEYLGSLGIAAKHRWRDFREHKTKTEDALNLAKIGKVYLFDNRINQQTIPVTEYLTALQSIYPHFTIELLDNLINAETYPVLLLQDGSLEDFLEKGILHNIDDPYKTIYHNPQYRHIPKQSININPNDSADFNDLEDYLDYTSILEDESYFLRFDVCMHQLYLKQIVVKDKSAFGLLPGLVNEESALTRYIFVRRKTYDGENYTVALHVMNGRICFLDLRNPEERNAFYGLADDRKVDWDKVLEQLAKQQFKDNPDELVRFDVIISDGIAIEIEDINERVLYDYGEIENRQYEADEARPIDDFRLTDYYDEVKNANMYTRAELEASNPTDSAKWKQSKALLAQFQALDAFLDELAQIHPEISYNDLVSGDRLERIGKIFNLPFLKPKQESKVQSKYNHAYFKRYYQKRNMFLSPKSKDVILYKGIWYDDENCYVVGNPEGMNEKQDKGNVIRRFNVVRGDSELLDIELLLDTMAVKFVRKNRYTVHSYLYHLVDLFVSEILQLSAKDSDIPVEEFSS